MTERLVKDKMGINKYQEISYFFLILFHINFDINDQLPLNMIIMNNKNFVLFFILMFFFGNSYLYAQEELKVIKVDNSKFPEIEIVLRGGSNVKQKDIFVYENNKVTDAKIDNVKQEDYPKGQSILFIIDVDATEKVRKTLANEIRRFKETDKINIGIILKSDTSENFIHFISPEFSNNHFYFINALEQNMFQHVNYTLKNRNKKNAKKLFKNMEECKECYGKKGIIFISKRLKIRPEPMTSFLTNPREQTYIVLTKEADNQTKSRLIGVCTKTGGIYTETKEENIQQTLERYIEDISLQINTSKSKVLRLTFITKQNNNLNTFEIKYLDQTIEQVFNKPQKKMFSLTEKGLLILSGLLFVSLIMALTKKKKKIRKSKVYISDKNIKKTGKSMPVKPIEINVKTKGFNKTYFFEKHIISIGRSSTNDIIIPDRTVSGSHAVINKEGEFFKIQDLGSTNGVVVNQKKIKTQKLVSKDKIKLGGAILVVRI